MKNGILLYVYIIKKDVEIMVQLIIKIISLVMVLVGLIMVYDARIITKKFFGFGDQNEASSGLKILGFILAIIGGLILYFNV